MENNDLLVKINQRYKSMSKGQKQLASYIMDNYDRAAFITASKMGRIVGVSESTVVRFAYALGYDGYPELQKSLQELIRNKLTSVQRIQLTSDLNKENVLESVLKSDMTNIRSTIESMDNDAFTAAVEALLKAKHIYVIGLRSASPLAQFLSYYLNFVLDNIMSISDAMSDVFEQMIRIGEGDICIGISFPRYSTRTVRAMSFAKERGAKIIAITDSASSPLAECADHLLIAHSNMASFADSLVAPLSVINALIVAASLERKTEVSTLFNSLEGIWDTEQVYLMKSGEHPKL